MKFGDVTSFASLALMLLTCSAFAQPGGQFSTVQNSTLSVPASQVLSAIASNGSAAGSSNWMVSAIAPVSAQGGVVSLVTSQEWVRRNSGGDGSSQNTPLAMVVRKDGSIVLCGYSLGQRTSYDFITLCYAADGTALWTNRYDGPAHENDLARLLAVNESGDVWVAGESKRSANTSIDEAVLIKYDRQGIPLWTNRVYSFETNSAYPIGLAADSHGNTYLSYWGIYWKPQPYFSGDLVETAVVKHDHRGNLVWAKRYLVTAPDSGQAIRDPYFMTIDGDGHLLLAGNSGTKHMNTGTSIMKFGYDGSALWTNHHPFPFILGLDALSLCASNSLIAVGTRYFAGEPTEVILKCSAEGSSLWTNQFVGPNYDGGYVPQIQSDSAGNTFVIAGSASSTASSGSYQVVKIDAAGIPLWTNQTIQLGTTNSQLSCSAIDHAGNLYLAGHAPVGTNVSRDYVVIKLSGDGSGVWTNHVEGQTGFNDLVSEMAVDNSGSVFVTGRSENPFGSQITTVKFSDSLFYTPPMDFTGVDSIAVTITDSLGADANSVVNIAVGPGSLQFTVSPKAITFNLNDARLVAHGGPNDHPVILEASSDLKTWQPIATNTPANGTAAFIDSSAEGHTRRFYRMSQRH